MVFKYWEKNRFTILVIASIFLLIACWIFLDHDEEGSWSDSVQYIPSKTFTKRKIPIDSKGERECRRVLEKYFRAPFPNTRPFWLHSQITGQPSEIDCLNETLKIGCEYNGAQHYKFVKQFHKNYEAFKNQQYRDLIKYRACEDRGIRLILVPFTVKHEDIENFIMEKLVELDLL